MNASFRNSRVITLLVALVCAAAPAQAQKSWGGTMSGSQEIPPNASPATGLAEVFLSGNLLTVDIIWTGLIGGLPSAAHIHCCVNPGSNVGVAVGFPGFPATTSGTYTHTFDLTNSSVYTSSFFTTFGGGTAAGAEAALIAGLDAGKAYANIHDATFPGGEIRADLVSTTTPEPSSIALVASGMVALVGIGRARKRDA